MENSNKKIRVLLVDDSFYPEINGPFNVVINYAKQINKHHECAICAPLVDKNNVYPNKDNFNIIYCKSMKGPGGYRITLPFFDKSIYKKIDEFKPDIIHLHSPAVLASAILKYGKKHHIPVIATLHTKFDFDLKVLLGKYNPLVAFCMHGIRKVFTDADASAAVSEVAIDMLKTTYLKRHDKPIYVLENGTNYRFPEDADKLVDYVNETYKLKNQSNVLFNIGRVVYYKNIFLICDALAILNKEHFDFKMVFAGNGPDLEKLKKYAADKGIADRCIFTGALKDPKIISGFYKRSDLVLFPSTYDTFSLVRLESAANKAPLMATKDSLTSYGIKDGFNGYLTNENAVDFANKIKEALKDKEHNRQVGENAFKTVYKSWDDLENMIITTYQKVIKDYRKN